MTEEGTPKPGSEGALPEEKKRRKERWMNEREGGRKVGLNLEGERAPEYTPVSRTEG